MAPTSGQLGVLGANVTPVPQSYTLAETQEDFLKIQDYTIPLLFQEAQRPVLGDAFKDDCAPWGFIAVETGSAFSAKSPAQGAYVTGVKYAKPKQPFDTGIAAVTGTSSGNNTTLTLKDTGKSWATNAYASYAVSITGGIGVGQWRPIVSNTATVLTVAKAWTITPDATSTYKIWAHTEVARSKDTGRLGRYLGTRTFLFVDSLAETLAETLYPELTAMEGSGNWSAALLREKTIERNWRVGLARVTCRYDTYSEIMEFPQIGKGILECDAETVLRYFKTDVAGQTVNTEFVEASRLRQWILIAGNQNFPFVTAKLRIRVLLSASNLTALTALVGKYNLEGCPNILNAPGGTLWFSDLSFAQRKRGSGILFDVVIYLRYNPDGWDEFSVVKKHEWTIKQDPEYKNDGVTPTGQTREVGYWKDMGLAPVYLQPTVLTSFDLIDGYLA